MSQPFSNQHKCAHLIVSTLLGFISREYPYTCFAEYTENESTQYGFNSVTPTESNTTARHEQMPNVMQRSVNVTSKSVCAE